MIGKKGYWKMEIGNWLVIKWFLEVFLIKINKGIIKFDDIIFFIDCMKSYGSSGSLVELKMMI